MSQPRRWTGRSTPGRVLRAVATVVLGWLITLAAADAAPPPLSAEDAAALHLGRRVQAVREAIRDPVAPQAMQAVTDLGLETEYYVMVRGWLTMQLQADTSLCEAWGEKPCPRKVRERIEFLQRAIRAIDLE